MKLFTLGCISLLFLFSSCISHKSLVNYTGGSALPSLPILIENPPQLTIQPNDILDIKVHSSNAELAAPFNIIPKSSLGMSNATATSLRLHGYLVNQKGMIDFPVIGTIPVQGLESSQLKEELQNKLKTYLKDPVVNIRLLNFKVTVSGEVNDPGSFNVPNERITLPEAITMAGDLTNYATRDSILIIRELDGYRTFKRVSMQSLDLFESDFYYLKQNDLIYIEPQKAKTGTIRDQSNEILPFISAAATILAIVLTIIRVK